MFEIIAVVCYLENGIRGECFTRTYVAETYDTLADCERARTGNPYIIWGIGAHLYETGLHNTETDRLECVRNS